jgi:hypothetical protein
MATVAASVAAWLGDRPGRAYTPDEEGLHRRCGQQPNFERTLRFSDLAGRFCMGAAGFEPATSRV